MPARGTKLYVGWGQETTWGTPVSITNYIPAVSESIKKPIERIISPSLRNSRSRDLDQVAPGSARIEGDIVTVLYVKGLLKLFKNALGAGSSAQQGGTAAYLHTFTLSDLPPGLTVVVGRDVKQWKYSGMKINQLKIEGRENQFLQATWSFVGKDETIEDVVSPSFPTSNNAFTFWSGYFKIDTVSTPIRSFELTLNNKLITDRYFQNQTLYDLYEGTREITGTFTMDVDMSQYAKFTNFTPAALVFEAKRNLIATSYYEEITITLPYVIYNGETPNVSGEGMIPHNIPFTAYASGSTAEMTITIQNTETAI